MRTSHEIYMDFQRAQSSAGQLDQLASRMDRIAGTQVENSMRNLSAGWKGESASLFLSKETSLQGDIRAAARNIRSTAGAIRDVARRLYEAEMEALRIAQTRRY